jgi:hypothetical protein
MLVRDLRISTPIPVQRCGGNITVDTRIRPIRSTTGIAVFYRIEVNVIHMSHVILFVTNQMLPISKANRSESTWSTGTVRSRSAKLTVKKQVPPCIFARRYRIRRPLPESVGVRFRSPQPTGATGGLTGKSQPGPERDFHPTSPPNFQGPLYFSHGLNRGTSRGWPGIISGRGSARGGMVKAGGASKKRLFWSRILRAETGGGAGRRAIVDAIGAAVQRAGAAAHEHCGSIGPLPSAIRV